MPEPVWSSGSEPPAPYLIDTHCHVHEPDYPLDRYEVLRRADAAGVKKLICVGTDEASSATAVEFAAGRSDIHAAVGVHPHEAKHGWRKIPTLLKTKNDVTHAPTRHLVAPGEDAAPEPASESKKIVAIGEIGLDYHYTHSPREVQIEALQAQIEIALRYDLPVIFHIRAAFHDFWPVFDAFYGIRGVLHSFTDTQATLEEGLKRGLFIGVNGISTFTKDKAQQTMFQRIPLERLLLETDAPYLTPVPFRGKVNEPAFVKEVAEHQAGIRDIPFGDIVAATTANAHALFALR